MQLMQLPDAPHSLVYYFALLADLCSAQRFQPAVRRLNTTVVASHAELTCHVFLPCCVRLASLF